MPPELSAQVRVFATGNGRKTDEAGAHLVALAALRAPGLVQVRPGEDLVVMGMLAGRRDELGRARTQVTGRLHRLLLELHIMAVVQLRNQARGRACYDARRDAVHDGHAGPVTAAVQRGLLVHAGRPETA